MTHMVEEAISESGEVIAVRVTNNERQEAPELASMMGYALVGTEPAFQILPYDKMRHRAVVQILPGFANNNTNGNVYIGTLAQVQNKQGGIWVSGSNFVYESAKPLFCAPDGANSLTVSVLDERFTPR